MNRIIVLVAVIMVLLWIPLVSAVSRSRARSIATDSELAKQASSQEHPEVEPISNEDRLSYRYVG